MFLYLTSGDQVGTADEGAGLSPGGSAQGRKVLRNRANQWHSCKVRHYRQFHFSALVKLRSLTYFTLVILSYSQTCTVHLHLLTSGIQKTQGTMFTPYITAWECIIVYIFIPRKKATFK